MEEQGIGISVDEFEKRKADGTMSGHVGFAESVGLMAEGLGLKVNSFAQDMTPKAPRLRATRRQLLAQ